MKPAAIYARVSSDRQKEEHTIASQTEALRAFALQQGFSVPDEWVFEDEGYSGATLIRPGLEKVRDLAAEGQIDAVLVHSPDRLSRKYAYQVLLMEEFARNNVETLFIKAPQTATPEDQLLLQFQGMIAEYERAQILERSRRGKRHRALQGVINVLSGAPYGYRYIRKSEHTSASYAIIDAEATVVRMIYELYTVRGLSIGAITRLLNEQGVATRKGISRWERSTIWAMLRNVFRATKITRRVAPSHRALSRAWCRAANAVTASIVRRRARVRAGSITIAAWVPMHGAILADRCVTANLCDKIFLTSWYGARSSNYWKVLSSFKRSWNDGWPQRAMPVLRSAVKAPCNASSRASKRAPIV